MTPQQCLLIIWARRKLILIVLPVTVVVALIVTLLMPKRYTAEVSIMVDVKADPIAGSVLPSMASPSYMMTQTEIIQSDRVAMRAVKLMHLDQSPPAVEMWNKSSSNKVPFDYYYGGLLLKGLVVKPFKGSNIITLTYSGQDPQFSAAVANAFAQAYIDTNGILVNPLVEEGYPSIGCAPCTAKPADGADPRSGRWQGLTKTECGMHVS